MSHSQVKHILRLTARVKGDLVFNGNALQALHDALQQERSSQGAGLGNRVQDACRGHKGRMGQPGAQCGS